LRQVLADLESAGEAGRNGELGIRTRELIRSYLGEHQDTVRDLQERLRLSSEEAELQIARRSEMEKVLLKRDLAYEELLGM